MRLLLLLLPLTAGCQGTWPSTSTVAAPPPLSGPGQPKSSSGERHGLLLWVPDEGAADWPALERALSRRSRLRVVVGAASGAISPAERERLKPLIASGRLELAARLPGDPVLPLLYDSQAQALRFEGTAPRAGVARPQDIAARLALEREAFRVAFGSAPAGFVPTGGAVTPELLGLIRNLGFDWVACGDYRVPGSTAGWYSAEGLLVVPFQAVTSSDTLPVFPRDWMSPVVLDESLRVVPYGSLEEVLEGGLAGEADRWWTVSQASSAIAASTASVPSALPGWKGSLSPWIGQPLQNTAWDLLGQASQALQRYQNSGRASLKVLDDTAQALYLAESGKLFMEFGRAFPTPERTRLDQDFRAALTKVFKLVGEAPPRELARPLGPLTDIFLESTETEKATFLSGPNWMTFLDDSDDAKKLPDVAARPVPWDLKGLKVEWDDNRINFSFSLPPFKTDASARYGFSGVIVDLYIDQNHRVGSGSKTLLAGRPGYTAPRDAWEYALSVSGAQAGLYQASRRGEPDLVQELVPRVSSASGEITLSVERSKLRGNPRFWGYLTVSMASDPAAPERPRSEEPIILDTIPPQEGNGAGTYSAVRAPREE